MTSLLRLLVLAAGFSLPGILVLLILMFAGALGGGAALLGILATIVLGLAALYPFAMALIGIRDAAEELADSGALAGRLRLATMLFPRLCGALARIERGHRERRRVLETELAGARSILAGLPEALILIDGQRRIVQANAPALMLLGPGAGSRDLADALRHPAVLEAADAVLRGEEVRLVAFTTTIPVERHYSAHFARIDQPAPDGTVAILSVSDITALKRSEQMRSDFIANASHELRTPLATLLGFIETLRGPARDDEPARERFLGIMYEQASRMSRLVDDLLSLSRIEMREHLPPTQHIDIVLLLGQVADALQLRAGARDMAIRLALPADLPPIRGNSDELAQLFQNLLDNAVKYGHSGTEITVSAGLVDESPLPAGAPGLRVSVRDRSDGIPSQLLHRLTERFYRVDTARSRQMGGTGLGLAIVKHVVNHHRGILEIESTLGVGSNFQVYLPR